MNACVKMTRIADRTPSLPEGGGGTAIQTVPPGHGIWLGQESVTPRVSLLARKMTQALTRVQHARQTRILVNQFNQLALLEVIFHLLLCLRHHLLNQTPLLIFTLTTVKQ